MTDVIVNRNASNFECYGKIFGCSSGIFEYRCNFCTDTYQIATEFEEHVLIHFVQSCIDVLPDILIPKEEKCQLPERDDNLEIKIEPDSLIYDDGLNELFHNDFQLPSVGIHFMLCGCITNDIYIYILMPVCSFYSLMNQNKLNQMLNPSYP